MGGETPPVILFSHKILSHIYRAGDENDKSLDDILHIRVDAEKGESDEDDSEQQNSRDNTAYLSDAANK